MSDIPVILFAYARPRHLARVLACLRENRVSLILAYADGAKGTEDAGRVAETRALLRAVDWCDLRLVEREGNLGLGANVLAGVGEAAAAHEAFIVWEDDLVCVPGTYAWMCAALRRYEKEPRVMSVSAWTHPRVTPRDVGESPYFDGRADCWVWGAWSRSWRGMADGTAVQKMRLAEARGIAPDAYGADLPEQAGYEARKNVWAVRWLYHHFQYGGLCLRPPWSMVEHIGFDAGATNAAGATDWANPPLRPAPPIPAVWPPVAEHVACRGLWVRANPPGGRVVKRLRRLAARVLRAMSAGPGAGGRRLLARVRRLAGRRECYHGDYADWAQARAASTGYEANAILEKVVASTRAVRDGRAVWERDTVLFHEPMKHEPLLRALLKAADADEGRLSVVDFGGALGSTWWQHRPWLGGLAELRWSVVEQAAFVAAGRAEFTVGALRFHETLERAFAEERPNVVLLSSVLPYLEDPGSVLADLARRECRWIIIDRTGFTLDGRDRLTVQRVPPEIYEASYPCWFFDQAGLLRAIGPGWRVVAEWPTFDGRGTWFEYRGLMLERTSQAGSTAAALA